MATDELVQIPNRQKSPGDEDSNQLLWFALGIGGYNVIKVAGNRPRFQDPHSNGSGFVDDICGSSGHLNIEKNAFQGFGSSAGRSTDWLFGVPSRDQKYRSVADRNEFKILHYMKVLYGIGEK
ncbi:uncharacterized protein LOC132047846 [Lycium ferocissimum]|uniref:uncharacterized protein LOC132047846 n=1 Tax=Lycium ferocissimum TaxID=112874 RepID=UPI0028151263|nr:uncharacterized protein LOC132047846 [Lycium ferocissimum]